MRRSLFLVLFVLFTAQPCSADTHYRIEVLQIGASNAFDTAYQGIVSGLSRQGFIKDGNLSISRTVLEVNSNPSLWQRLAALFHTRSIASSVIKSRPDLVITLGAQATKTFREKITRSGIPVLYSGVCCPDAASAGVAIRSQPFDMVGAAVLALPDIDLFGIIRTSDPQAVAFAREMEQEAGLLGIQVITREITPSESVRAAAKALMAQGVDAFVIPTDSYFETNVKNAAADLIAEATTRRIPCISALPDTAKGTLMTLAPDFEAVGDFTATQASRLLTHDNWPGDLSAVMYTDQNFIVNLSISKRLGIRFRDKSSTFLSLNN